jgi:GNAT superfamily N-acetyltransferase
MPNLEVTETIPDNDLAAIKAGLAQSYVARGGVAYDPRNIAVFLRDEQGKLIAGLTGETVWNHMYVAFFWVAESHRNKGLGEKILRRAEDEARQRGCHTSYLFTQSYGAPAFYKRLGYHNFFTLDNCPPGFEQIGFMKRLAA